MKLFLYSSTNKTLCVYKKFALAVLFLFTQSITYAKSIDLTQLPQLPQQTSTEWRVHLQAPQQALWQGQVSHWYLISLNPPSGNAQVTLPNSDTFSFLAGKAIAINSNGKIGWAYPIQITPITSGNLTIPEINLSYSAETLSTHSQQVSVKYPELSSKMNLELSVNKDDIYIGQSIRLTTSWTFDYPVKDLKGVNLHIPNLLDNTYTVAKPWNKADDSSKQSIGLPVNGQRQIAHWQNLPNNQVRIFFDVVIKPKSIGEHIIAPATLLTAVINRDNQPNTRANKKRFKGTQYIAYYNNNFFEIPSDQEKVDIVLSQSPTLTFNVKPLPNNIPTNFSGIIGRPIIQVDVQPNKVKTGEAIQYALTIIHPDIETINLPELTQLSSFIQSFNMPAQPSISITDVGSKVISQSLFPRRADIAAIPEFTVNYLEPETGLYRDLIIENQPIEVEENDNFNFSDIEGSQNSLLKNTIKRDPDGVWALRWRGINSNSSNNIDTSKAISLFLNQTWVLFFLLLLPPLVITLLLIKPMKQRLYQHQIKQPATQLKIALTQGKEPLHYLSRYCYLRFALTPSKFNTKNLQLKINEYIKCNANAITDADTDVIDQPIITELVEWIEQYQVRYANDVNKISASETKQLVNIIDKLEQYLPKYQEGDMNTNSSHYTPSSATLGLLSSMAYIVFLGLSTYSENIFANETKQPKLDTALTIETLHSAHQQALQLSIDAPHKGSLAHAKIAKQLTSFVDTPNINKADLFYDIGTTWFQAGQYGKSILWLRRAENISADDSVLLHNLAQARSKRLDQLPDNFSAPWLNKAHKVISSPFWLIMCWLGYFVLWLIIWRRITHKDLSNKKLVCILVFVSFSGLTQITRFQYKPQLSEAVITSQEVISRKGPGLIFSPAFTTPLHQGAELVVLKIEGQWTEVKLTNGERCWLPSRTVSMI